MANHHGLLLALGFALACVPRVVQGFGGLPESLDTRELLAYLPFTGNAEDASGHGRHGTVTGASLAAAKDGSANSAYVFNGNSIIQLADAEAFSSARDAFTITALVRATSNDGANIIASQWNDGTSKWRFICALPHHPALPLRAALPLGIHVRVVTSPK